MMKNYLSLLGIQMREVMWVAVALAFLAVGLIIYGLPLLTVSMTYSGLSMVLSSMSCFYGVLLAYFLIVKDRTTWARDFRLMAHAEFLISRPILRKTGYAAFMTIYFVIVLGPSVVSLGYAGQSPSLEFLCYQSADRKSEAAANRDNYLQILPGSYIRERPKSSPIIVWPHGAVYVAAWKLLIMVAFAILIQFVVFLKFPNPTKTIAAVVILQMPFLFFLLTRTEQSAWFPAYQSLFGFFISHWVAVTSSAILVVLVLELLAFRLSAESEIT